MSVVVDYMRVLLCAQNAECAIKYPIVKIHMCVCILVWVNIYGCLSPSNGKAPRLSTCKWVIIILGSEVVSYISWPTDTSYI